jgi:hypothetical protein
LSGLKIPLLIAIGRQYQSNATIVLSRSSAVLEAEMKHDVISALEAGFWHGESDAFMCCALARQLTTTQLATSVNRNCGFNVDCMNIMVWKTPHFKAISTER